MSLLVRRLVPGMAIFAFVAACMLTSPHSTARAASAAANGNCGSIELGTPASTTGEVAQGLGCFQSALQTCEPVSLIAAAHVADAVVTRTFLTVPEDRGCGIAETVERNEHGKVTTDSFLCLGMRRDKDQSVFTSCGHDGDIALPNEPSATAAAAFIKERS